GSADLASSQVASGGYHRGLGVGAVAGRLFAPEDDQPNAVPVAVISYRLWQRRFGGSADTIGKVVTINNVRVTLVGVTAPAFNGARQAGEPVALTLPLALAARFARNRGEERTADYWWVRIMGRMKRGVTIEQTCASLEGVFHESARGNVGVTTLPGAPAV